MRRFFSCHLSLHLELIQLLSFSRGGSIRLRLARSLKERSVQMSFLLFLGEVLLLLFFGQLG